jgi:hypothetical protein
MLLTWLRTVASPTTSTSAICWLLRTASYQPQHVHFAP